MDRLEQSLREIESAAHTAMLKTRETAEFGPFRAYFDPLNEMIWLNYAAPIRPLDSPRQVRRAMRDLRDEFARRQRRPRFEFMLPLWPQLPQMLLDEGMILQAEQPLMLCTADTFKPREARDLRIRALSASDDDGVLEIFEHVAWQGFAEHGIPPPPPSLRDRLREELRSGMRFGVIGYVADEPAGVAGLSPMGEPAELVGVATLHRFRRRGIASALSSRLLADHFARGKQVAWLSAEGAIPQTAYRQIGFCDAGIYANYFDPAGS